MAALVMPTGQGAPRYRYRVELVGREYAITTAWNEREGAWFLDVHDAEGMLLRGGVKVVRDWPLLTRGGDDRLPPGDLIALDASREGLELVFLEAEEP